MTDTITCDTYELEHAAIRASFLQPTDTAVPVYRMDLPELEALAWRTDNALALQVLSVCSEALEYMPVIHQLQDYGDADDLVASYEKSCYAASNLEELVEQVQTDSAHYIDAIQEALDAEGDTARVLLDNLIGRIRQDAKHTVKTYGAEEVDQC